LNYTQPATATVPELLLLYSPKLLGKAFSLLCAFVGRRREEDAGTGEVDLFICHQIGENRKTVTLVDLEPSNTIERVQKR